MRAVWTPLAVCWSVYAGWGGRRGEGRAGAVGWTRGQSWRGRRTPRTMVSSCWRLLVLAATVGAVLAQSGEWTTDRPGAHLQPLHSAFSTCRRHQTGAVTGL